MTLEKKIKDMTPKERKELNKRYMQQYLSKKTPEEIELMKQKAKDKYAEKKTKKDEIISPEEDKNLKKVLSEITPLTKEDIGDLTEDDIDHINSSLKNYLMFVSFLEMRLKKRLS